MQLSPVLALELCLSIAFAAASELSGTLHAVYEIAAAGFGSPAAADAQAAAAAEVAAVPLGAVFLPCP
jgi:hypothetical protein